MQITLISNSSRSASSTSALHVDVTGSNAAFELVVRTLPRDPRPTAQSIIQQGPGPSVCTDEPERAREDAPRGPPTGPSVESPDRRPASAVAPSR